MHHLFIAPVLGMVFIGLPWLILHYVTKWKTAATLTHEDEVLLDDLYRLAGRLEERMQTVERLVRAEHPDFTPANTPVSMTPASPQTERTRP